MPRGLFLTSRNYLDVPGGGVQKCTSEYLGVLRTAGLDLSVITFDGDRRLSTRLLRRIDSSPYMRTVEPGFVDAILDRILKETPDFVFLNQVALASIAGALRKGTPVSTPIVLLSHGLESTDLLHVLRLRRKLPLSGRVRPTGEFALGRLLRKESELRSHVDAVLALSAFDVELEHWIGARNVHWLARVVTPSPLDWSPLTGRLGFVGTLDHAPNLEGLVAVAERLADQARNGLRIRVVGGPERLGLWLAHRYPVIDYLGQLDDPTLADEAATWNGFLHPIFCHPRGCSTKLATAIAWQIPILTTSQGRRGYVWTEGSLLEANTPETFAQRALDLFDPAFARAARADVARVAASSPRLADIAAQARIILGLSDPAAAPP